MMKYEFFPFLWIIENRCRVASPEDPYNLGQELRIPSNTQTDNKKFDLDTKCCHLNRFLGIGYQHSTSNPTNQPTRKSKLMKY